eukprot:7401038-Lingulodinium_polyedra.AAC.1
MPKPRAAFQQENPLGSRATPPEAGSGRPSATSPPEWVEANSATLSTRAPFPLRSPRPPSMRVHLWSRRLSPTQTLLCWAAP